MKWLLFVTVLVFTQTTPRPTTPAVRPPIPYREGKCQAYFPTEARWERQWVNTSQGRILLDRVVAEANGGRVVYLIGWHDLPKATRNSAPPILLDRMRDGLVSSLEGTLVSEGPCRSERLTGLECRVRNAQGLFVRARFFLVKERMYQAMVVGAPAEMDPSTQQFFDNFKVLP